MLKWVAFWQTIRPRGFVYPLKPRVYYYTLLSFIIHRRSFLCQEITVHSVFNLEQTRNECLPTTSSDFKLACQAYLHKPSVPRLIVRTLQQENSCLISLKGDPRLNRFYNPFDLITSQAKRNPLRSIQKG